MGPVNLTGSPTFAVATQVQVGLGALNDNGSAKTITINGADTTSAINLTGAAASFVAGSKVQVNSGTLLVSNPTGSATGSGSVIIANGADLGGTGTISTAVTIPGGSTLFTGLTNNTLNKTAGVLGIGAGSNLQGSTLMDLTAVCASDELVIGGNGAVTLAGPLTVTDPNTATYPLVGIQSFKLFSYAPGATQFSSVSLPALSGGLSWNTSQLYSAGIISIAGVTANTITWNNGLSSTGNGSTWDGSILASSQNFNNSGTAANFTPGDNVTFNDSNNGHYTVTINGFVNPGSLVINNGAGNYVFNGTGSIIGSVGLTKSGTGSLTLSTSNSYTGPTVINGGAVTLTVAGALPSGTALTIGSSASVVVNSLGNAVALNVSSLSDSGLLDLNNNDLIVQSHALSAVTALVQSGYDNGNWNGLTGIVSSTAANNPSHLTALGVISNDNGMGSPLYGSGGRIASTFGGATPVDGNILVKYTYYGDANLDGKVDGSDYSRIDAAFVADEMFPGTVTGWYNGDFNYDGVIDGSDYTLIDNAFNTQAAQISAQIDPAAIATDQIAGGAGASAVPEPATLGLLGIGAIGLLGRRRRGN